MSKSASIYVHGWRFLDCRVPRKKGNTFKMVGGKKTGATAQPRYNSFRVICDRVITALQCICTVVTIMGKQCWSQAVLESGSWGHRVLQTPALVQNEVSFLGMAMSYQKKHLSFQFLCFLKC